jgi:hypothetical protein
VVNTVYYQREVITAARAAGADIDQWAVAKVIHAVGGPAAEVRVRGLPLWTVADQPACRSDLNDAAQVAYFAGWSDEKLDTCVENSAGYLDRMWSYPPAWRRCWRSRGSCRTAGLSTARTATKCIPAPLIRRQRPWRWRHDRL